MQKLTPFMVGSFLVGLAGILEVWVLQALWTWFAVPLGAPYLAFNQVLPLWLMYQLPREPFDSEGKIDRLEQRIGTKNATDTVQRFFLIALARPLVIWVIGYAIHAQG